MSSTENKYWQPKVTMGDHSCVKMDASQPYGSARPDGWLDVMHRFVCPLVDGSNILIDVIKVKENREALSLYGSQYGGPDFNEPTPASQRLTIDEYFYTDTAAEVEVVDGIPMEKEFDRTGIQRCSHVDCHVQDDPSNIVLSPVCGIGSFRDADGGGLISGISANGEGRFEYDGLVTSVDRWLRAHHLKQRRFRFVSDDTVGPQGDVRVFVLKPYPASEQTPYTFLSKCSLALGCANDADPVSCTCVQTCLSGIVSWIVVMDNDLTLIETVGSCDNAGTPTLDDDTVHEIKTRLGFSTATSTPSDTPSSIPSSLPSSLPSQSPSSIQSNLPSTVPSSVPSLVPSNLPSALPSSVPSILPSLEPSSNPTESCRDDPSFEIVIGKKRWTCNKIKKPNHIKKVCNKKTDGGVVVKGKCKEACNNCGVTLCKSFGSYDFIKKTLCVGRAKDEENKFPIFWKISKNKKKVLNKECASSTCKASDCCNLGPERKCSTTGVKGLVNGGFTQKMCGNKFTLRKSWQLKNIPCTNQNGKKCKKQECCKKKKK